MINGLPYGRSAARCHSGFRLLSDFFALARHDTHKNTCTCNCVQINYYENVMIAQHFLRI